MHASVEQVNPNDAQVESISAIYDWMVAERAATKKRKWEEKQKQQAKKNVQKK